MVILNSLVKDDSKLVFFSTTLDIKNILIKPVSGPFPELFLRQVLFNVLAPSACPQRPPALLATLVCDNGVFSNAVGESTAHKAVPHLLRYRPPLNATRTCIKNNHRQWEHGYSG